MKTAHFNTVCSQGGTLLTLCFDVRSKCADVVRCARTGSCWTATSLLSESGACSNSHPESVNLPPLFGKRVALSDGRALK